MGGGGGIGNKAQLRPAKLELGLGLSLAILAELIPNSAQPQLVDDISQSFVEHKGYFVT